MRKQVEVSGGFEDVVAHLDSNDGVMMGDIDPVLKDRLIRYCFERKIPICIVSNAAETVLRSAYTISLLDTLALICRKGELSLLEEFIKRCFDIIVWAVHWWFSFLSCWRSPLRSNFMIEVPVFYKHQTDHSWYDF